MRNVIRNSTKWVNKTSIILPLTENVNTLLGLLGFSVSMYKIYFICAKCAHARAQAVLCVKTALKYTVT